MFMYAQSSNYLIHSLNSDSLLDLSLVVWLTENNYTIKLFSVPYDL